MTRFRLVLRVALFGVAVALPVLADAPISGNDRQYAEFAAGDKVIRDRFTKLVWERPSRPYPPPMTFVEAQTYCKPPMRLPSLKELLTIVDEEPHEDYEVDKAVLRYIDEPAFGGTPVAVGFWTSSMKSATEAWTVDFGSGDTKPAALGDNRYVRCVDYVP